MSSPASARVRFKDLEGISIVQKPVFSHYAAPKVVRRFYFKPACYQQKIALTLHFLAQTLAHIEKKY